MCFLYMWPGCQINESEILCSYVYSLDILHVNVVHSKRQRKETRCPLRRKRPMWLPGDAFTALKCQLLVLSSLGAELRSLHVWCKSYTTGPHRQYAKTSPVTLLLATNASDGRSNRAD